MTKYQTGGSWGYTNPTAINPLTNLQTEQDADWKYISPEEHALDTGVIYDTQHTREGLADLSYYTDPIEKYTEYGVPLGRRNDWNDERANNQSTGEKWRRGLSKAAITTVGAVAENTLGVLAGLGEVLTGGQYYDNAIGRSVDKMNDWAREEMPNYYTQAEQNAGLWQRMGSANFWADKAANGLGYSIGSIATMAMTGGAGYGALVTNLAAKAMNMKKGVDLATKAAKIHKLYKVSKGAARGEKLAKMMGQVSQAQRFKRGAQMLDAAVMMSLAEASVESRETKNHVYETLINEELNKLNLTHASQLPQEKLNQIQRDANAAGNANFGMNMSVLSVSNAYMFGKMLGPKYVAGRVPVEGLKKEGVNKVVDTTTKGWRKAYKKLKPTLQGLTAEGIQEGSQYASNIAATEFATSKYSDQGGITRMQALNEGLSRTFGETDGLESIMLGMITGGIMGGGGSLISKPAKTRDQRANDLLKILNSGALDSSVERGQNQERTLFYLKKMEEAREQGNEELFEQYRTQAIISDAITLEEAGQIDLYYEKLDDTLSLSDEEFAKEFGHDPDAKLNKHKIVEDLKKDIALAVKRKTAVDAMFPITQTRGLPRLLMSEEERNTEKQKNIETLMLRDHLLQNAVFLDKVSGRKRDIARKIAEVYPGISLSMLEKAADRAKEHYDSMIEGFINETEGVTNEKGLPQDLRDRALASANQQYIFALEEGLTTDKKINPLDLDAVMPLFGAYYGLHSNEQEMFENWNRLQTSQGREQWLRVALMDQEEQAKDDADAAVEDMIQQETDPEKLATNTPRNARKPAKRKVKKEGKNINNIKKNIIDKYGKDSVSMEELEAAIEDRLPVEMLAQQGFKSEEEKQAYIELQTLRALRQRKKENAGEEQRKMQAREYAKKVNEILYTALLVNDPVKLKRVFKPVHPNQYYDHSTIEVKPDNINNIEPGKKHKLKIIGRLKTNKIDVLLVENPKSTDMHPHILLSTISEISPAEAHTALKTALKDVGVIHPDSKSSKIKGLTVYKNPKFVQVTEGYVDGNNNKHTTTLEESTPQETIDSPAKVDDQGQTEVEGRPSENIIEEDVSQGTEFTDDSEFVIFEDEFIDPEIQAAELNAQNAEAAAMAGQEIQELGSIPTQEELLALEAEEKALLEEEAKLRNSLNKEDENCAT